MFIALLSILIAVEMIRKKIMSELELGMMLEKDLKLIKSQLEGLDIKVQNLGNALQDWFNIDERFNEIVKNQASSQS